MVDCLHSNACRVFAVAFLIQLYHGIAVMLLGRVQGVEFARVRPQLLHGSCAERVTGSDQHAQSVLHQPEGNLRQ